MLDWNDEIATLTGAELNAFKRGGCWVNMKHAYIDYVGRVLRSGVAKVGEIRDVLDGYLNSIVDRNRRGRILTLLRAKVLRRYSGERLVRALSSLTDNAKVAQQTSETGSAAVLANRVALLGAPPKTA